MSGATDLMEFGHGEEPYQRQTRVCQERMNALTDSLDLCFARQSGERRKRIIGHYIIKSAYQSLV
jgi:hypothetical protein